MKTLIYLFLAAVFLSACGQGAAENKTITPQPQINTSSATSVNPAHGLPGHNCAVPVGAPLPATGTVQAPTFKNNTPVQTEVQNLPVEANKTLKVNPAHGQPGHRCDIAVGATL